MTRQLPAWHIRARRGILFVAAALALLLLGLDRYAAIVHRPDADSTRVVIYTTAWCPYCARLRATLAASAIPFRDYDVERSLQGQLGFWALRGRGVPVSVIGPEIVYGYDQPRLAAAFDKLGYRFAPPPSARAADDGGTGSPVPGRRP